MTHSTLRVTGMLSIALAWAGCSALDSTGGNDSLSGGKADQAVCADQDGLCAPVRESALEALGLSSRFYRDGDRWQTLWVYRNHTGALIGNRVSPAGRTAAADPSDVPGDGAFLGMTTLQPPTVVEYEVIKTGTAKFGAATRDIATVRVGAGDNDVVENRLGDMTFEYELANAQLAYTINDNMNPVTKTFYEMAGNGDFEEVVTLDLDGRSNLTMQGDSLPNAYPNLDAIVAKRPSTNRCTMAHYEHLMDQSGSASTACWGTLREALPYVARDLADYLIDRQIDSVIEIDDDAPALPKNLEELADALGIPLDKEGLHIRATPAQPDYMFWIPDDLHPTYVEGPRGFGALISQSFAN